MMPTALATWNTVEIHDASSADEPMPPWMSARLVPTNWPVRFDRNEPARAVSTAAGIPVREGAGMALVVLTAFMASDPKGSVLRDAVTQRGHGAREARAHRNARTFERMPPGEGGVDEVVHRHHHLGRQHLQRRAGGFPQVRRGRARQHGLHAHALVGEF